DLPEGSLVAPEATERELRDLVALRVGPVQRRVQDLVQCRHRHRLRPAGQRVLGTDHLRLPEPKNTHRASFFRPRKPQYGWPCSPLQGTADALRARRPREAEPAAQGPSRAACPPGAGLARLYGRQAGGRGFTTTW